MRQKSLNENIKAREQSKGDMTSDIDDIDELLDDEGWDILNSLTEEELASLNSDFDPENMLIPTGERVNHEKHIPGPAQYEKQEVKPMFSQKDLVKTMDTMLSKHQRGERQEAPAVNSTLHRVSETTSGETMFNQKDLVASLNKMVEQSKPVIQNDKIREKEEERQRKAKEEFNKKARAQMDKENEDEDLNLSLEEELLLADATEEELIEAAALLNMNDILTSDQINAVFAGDKPAGTMKSSVKSTVPKQARITKADVETELDVVILNSNLKNDSEALFYLCVNNQPLLEREIIDLIIKCVGESKNMKHLSLSMLGLTDKRTIALAEAIGNNTQLETINLDSNIIGMPGIEALMNVVSVHPTIREFKVSNQKQPFGGQGEECMASAIAKNENILKFGYSFRQAAPRNKADRAIIRNNEIMRQRRKNGEQVYDLKAVCKIRDPWPQPWIKIKGQRLLGSQLEAKVTDMGLMIDVDADAGRESRGPKVREEREAKPLDIAALLAARATKLKGSNVANLEKETEERRKKTLLAMKESEEESGRVGTMLKKSENTQQSKTPSPNLGNNRDTPPVEEEKEEIKKKEEEKKETPKEPEKKGGNKIAQLDDSKTNTPMRRKKKDTEEEDRKKAEEEEKKKQEEDEKKKKIEEEEKKKKIEEEERKKAEDERQRKEEEEKKKEEEEKKAKLGSKKIAALAPVEDTAPVRRRKPKTFDDEPTDFLADAPKKEEPKEEPKKEEVVEKPLTAAEERAKSLKERREALAARKAGTTPKPATETPASTEKPAASSEATEKPLSAAEERAKSLRERREALAAKKAGQQDKSAAAPASQPESTPPAEDDKARSLRERREKLEAKRSAMNNPTAEATPAAAEKPKIDVANSLGGAEEAKPLSLKERRALLAEKKRLMGK